MQYCVYVTKLNVQAMLHVATQCRVLTGTVCTEVLKYITTNIMPFYIHVHFT